MFSAPPSIDPTFLKLDIPGALSVGILNVVLVFFLVELFDATGTLMGVASRAGLLVEGKMERLNKALLADSAAIVAGATLGTSSTTAYLESASGVQAGGRTGLTAVTVAVLFLACLFIAPLAGTVPAYATAPALLYVSCLMLRELVDTAVDTFDIAYDTVVGFLREVAELGEAPDRTRQGIVAALSVMLATYLALLLEIQSPWWAAISAFMSLTATGGGSLRRGLLRLSGTAAGALLGFVMARWLPYDHVALYLFVAAVPMLGVIAMLTLRRPLSIGRLSESWIVSAKRLLSSVTISGASESPLLHSTMIGRSHVPVNGGRNGPVA